jgi:hypothetical protein
MRRCRREAHPSIAASHPPAAQDAGDERERPGTAGFAETLRDQVQQAEAAARGREGGELAPFAGRGVRRIRARARS